MSITGESKLGEGLRGNLHCTENLWHCLSQPLPPLLQVGTVFQFILQSFFFHSLADSLVLINNYELSLPGLFSATSSLDLSNCGLDDAHELLGVQF